MKSDIFSNPIYQETDLIDLIYKNKLDLFDQVLVEDTIGMELFKTISGLDIRIAKPDMYSISKEEFDKTCQQDWFIPDEYKDIDIEAFLVDECPKEHYQRLIDELQEFQARNMLPLLRVLKYIVDTLRKNNILWGVGRGSSVASYTLYLIGIHKINSIKYDLDWREFLR
jgi:DNA polymerase III alpha subunit